MFHKMMGGKKMWHKKKAHMKKMWMDKMQQQGFQPGQGCPMKFFKKMFHGGKGHCGMWKKWKHQNKDFNWKEMTPEKKFWFKMLKNKHCFFKMMKNEEFFNKMMEKFQIDPKASPELMKLLEEKKQFWSGFKKDKKDFDWDNMSDEKKFWTKVMMKKGFFWKMLKNEKLFNKMMEEHKINPENAPELFKMLKAKRQFVQDLKGKGKFWKRRHGHGSPGRRGHGGPMKRFWRMMMGGHPFRGFGGMGPHHRGPHGPHHRGPHGGPGRHHGGRRHGGPGRRHGCGKFWRRHCGRNQEQEMSYEDQLQLAL